MNNLPKTKELLVRAREECTVIPGFNIPYLPMMLPVVQALKDTQTFGLIMVARLEWVKFQSKSIKHIYDEYQRVKDERYTRLHLDHVPVIDEDNLRIDYYKDIREALDTGYDSVMIDGSRLPLDANIECTRSITELAQQYGVAVEAELGAVMGHENGPMPTYEELIKSGKGFTSPEEAARFVKETGTDWLSVAIGNVHGAISAAKRTEKKVEAILDIAHLDKISKAVNIPLVLHGGTGIQKKYIIESFKHGISKINIATAIRQPYEALMNQSVSKAQESVYKEMIRLIKEELEIAGTALKLNKILYNSNSINL